MLWTQTLSSMVWRDSSRDEEDQKLSGQTMAVTSSGLRGN